MVEQQQTQPIKVPAALSQLIVVNVKYKVLLCIKPNCRKAVNLVSIVEHLRKIHKEKLAVRKQVEEFVTKIS
jgi:hypothetical protein